VTFGLQSLKDWILQKEKYKVYTKVAYNYLSGCMEFTAWQRGVTASRPM
jgi:hypothetical protein